MSFDVKEVSDDTLSVASSRIDSPDSLIAVPDKLHREEHHETSVLSVGMSCCCGVPNFCRRRVIVILFRCNTSSSYRPSVSSSVQVSYGRWAHTHVGFSFLYMI